MICSFITIFMVNMLSNALRYASDAAENVGEMSPLFLLCCWNFWYHDSPPSVFSSGCVFLINLSPCKEFMECFPRLVSFWDIFSVLKSLPIFSGGNDEGFDLVH